MHKLIARTLFAAVAAVAALALSATSAFAATWTATGGPNFSATGQVTVETSTCDSQATGTVNNGSGLPGAGIGKIDTVNYTNCRNGLIPFTMTAGHLPWSLNADSFASPVSTGTISGIHLSVSAIACSFVVDGTGPAANDGFVNDSYNNSTRQLIISASGGNLHYYNVSGCSGLIASGDPLQVSASYNVTGAPVNPIQITSP